MSLQANELRIGNLLMYGNRMAVVSAIFKSHFRCESLEQIDFGNSLQSNFQPIPLTPEILEKCGFDNDDNDFLNTIDERSSLHINLEKQRTLIESYDGIIKLNNIKHLHQLQNLYFALTGEELEYKQ